MSLLKSFFNAKWFQSKMMYPNQTLRNSLTSQKKK
jgi:hypothetical protein